MPRVFRTAAAASLLLITSDGCARAEESLPAQTVVVFNNAVRESRDLAKFYAQKRGIATDHLVGLECPATEEISRQEYDATIAEPLRRIFEQRQWWTVRHPAEAPPALTASSIRYVALIKGMPLKIRAASDYPGDKSGGGAIESRNEASVDSELTVLGAFAPQISGIIGNPYFQSYRRAGELENKAMLLVCRLDAPAAATVRRMITDAVETEKSGLWGRAFVDGAGNKEGGFAEGDLWLGAIVEQLRKAGVPTVYENTPAVLPDGYPITDCAVYYGWYTDRAAGPFARDDFHFLPGAVAAHIHSFSASTLRDPQAGWSAPLVTRGAACSLGNVYEPYLQLTTQLDIFNDRLLHGFTFAESAYIATRALSWMTVMLGDPLYRPYATWMQLDAKSDSARIAPEWRTYRDFAVKNAGRPAAEYRGVARQLASRTKNGPMLEDLGLQEAQEENFAGAVSYFQQARAIYTKRDDILRVVLEEADAWTKQGNRKRALELVRSVLRIVSDAPAAALLRQLESQLAPQPTATPPR